HTPHWFNFTFDGSTGATFSTDAQGRTVITLHFVDGQRGDGDLTANGVIVDPGAPALLPVSTGNVFVTGADAGGGPHVRVFDGEGLHEKFSFYAFSPSFTGGVRVALGDVAGDGTPDVIAAAGPGGGPHVRVFNGKTGQQINGPLGSFYAYGAGF